MIFVNGKLLDQRKFPDGSLLMNVSKFETPEIKWLYESDSELWTIIALAKHLKVQNKKIALNMPYCPHARQDRVKAHTDVFTLKYFCEIINSLGFSDVEILDPHSNVCVALMDNVYVKNADYFIEEAIEKTKPTVLFFPDEGSQKRYSQNIHMPSIVGMKKRKWETGEITGLDIIGEIPDKPFDVLIVDDICSYGGTFYHSAKKLKELGADKIHLYVTHCENSILEGKFTDKNIPLLDTGLITSVHTTNSIFTKKHPLVNVMEVV